MALDYEDPFDSSGGGNSTAVPTDPTAPTGRGPMWDPARPPRAARDGYEWKWQGGWDENGQGWQESPIGGWTSPTNEQVANDVDQNEPNVASPATWDVGRWNAYGVDTDSIFDRSTGQLRPGWTRTARGYENSSLYPRGPGSTNVPPPDPRGPGPGGGGGSTPISSVPGADGETATAFDWPGWQSAGEFVPRDNTFEYTPFSHDPYTASSWEDAEKEPGYGASRTQLRKQIEAGAAHRGMLRSGMTIGDLYTGLDSLGQQNFANFDNRRFRNYSENRNNAFQSWSGNLGADAQKFALELGADRDVYDRKATDIDRGNNYRYNVASSQFQDLLSRWTERVRSLTQISAAGMNS